MKQVASNKSKLSADTQTLQLFTKIIKMEIESI